MFYCTLLTKLGYIYFHFFPTLMVLKSLTLQYNNYHLILLLLLLYVYIYKTTYSYTTFILTKYENCTVTLNRNVPITFQDNTIL